MLPEVLVGSATGSCAIAARVMERRRGSAGDFMGMDNESGEEEDSHFRLFVPSFHGSPKMADGEQSRWNGELCYSSKRASKENRLTAMDFRMPSRRQQIECVSNSDSSDIPKSNFIFLLTLSFSIQYSISVLTPERFSP